MDELGQFKVAANELSRNIASLKSIVDGVEKSVADAKKQKEQYEYAAETARNDYRKNIALAGDYLNEFQKTKKAEHDKVEQDKKEAKKMLEEAGDKLIQAQKVLTGAEEKDKVSDSRLKVIEAREKDLERKEQLARSFAQNFK